MSKMEYLTNTEELMMKCIWNYGKEMPFLRMGEELKDKFHKEYKRTSIRTYLFRLEEKIIKWINKVIDIVLGDFKLIEENGQDNIEFVIDTLEQKLNEAIKTI